MPRLLDPVTNLEEIEKILNSTHWLEMYRKKKIVSSVKEATIVIHENADGQISIYSTWNEPNFKRKKSFREGGGVYFFIFDF